MPVYAQYVVIETLVEKKQPITLIKSTHYTICVIYPQVETVLFQVHFAVLHTDGLVCPLLENCSVWWSK